MPAYTIKELAENCGGRLHGHSPQAVVKYLATETSEVFSPRETLFFVLPEAKYCCGNLLARLYEKGVVNFVVSDLPPGIKKLPEVNFLISKDPREMLYKVAAFHRSRLSCQIACITGNAGVEVLKEWIFQLLHPRKKIVKGHPINNLENIPLFFREIDESAGLGLLEVSVAKPGEIKYLEKVIKPQIGVLTTTHLMHGENFSSAGEKIKEHLLLFKDCKVLIYCSDNELIDKAVKESGFSRTFCWAAGKSADIRVISTEKLEKETVIEFLYRDKNLKVAIPFIDEISVENALHAAAFACYTDEWQVLESGRMQWLRPVFGERRQESHVTRLEVNFPKMLENVNYFRRNLDPGTRVMAVVKAFSYGTGLIETAAFLQHHGADYLAVAFTDEGVALRKAGIDLPIMVFNPDPASYPLITGYSLEPELYSFRGMRLFNEFISEKGLDKYPVHIKLETGMNRLGFLPAEIDRLIEECIRSKRLKIKSVLSHLAVAEDPRHDEFTREQAEKFIFLTRKLEKGLGCSFMRHILNSAGIERFPEYQFQMVRLGIGMYGITSLNNVSLANVCSFKSVISQIKRVGPGESVGYGRKGRINDFTDIAVVPVGYADGLRRKLGNGRWTMLVKGHNAPVIGNVCMDMCMIDVSGIGAIEGDEVIIFGESNTISNMASALGTIPYEVLTSVSSRVRRVYLHK